MKLSLALTVCKSRYFSLFNRMLIRFDNFSVIMQSTGLKASVRAKHFCALTNAESSVFKPCGGLGCCLF